MTARDFGRLLLRAAIIALLLFLTVVTGWLVLAETHFAVVLQFAAMALYILAAVKALPSAVGEGEIAGRGALALGTLGLLCTALGYLHAGAQVATAGQYLYAGGAFAALLALGLWLLRPIGATANSDPVPPEAAGFAAFHADKLADRLRPIEAARRKFEGGVWRLAALGAPVAVLAGLAIILQELAGRPPGWLFLPTALLLLFLSSGAAFYRWTPAFEQRGEILRCVGEYLGLAYEYGGGNQPDHNTATIFSSAHTANALYLLPDFRELKLGATFHGNRGRHGFMFGEVTTIPPRKLGQNTARQAREFLLLSQDCGPAVQSRTLVFPIRPLFGQTSGPIHALGQFLGPSRVDLPARLNGTGDDAFDRRFEVYAEDSQEAMALLSPAFRARMLQACDGIGNGRLAGFAFDQGRFRLAAEAKQPWFEPRPDRGVPADDLRFADMVRERLRQALNFVETYDVDQLPARPEPTGAVTPRVG